MDNNREKKVLFVMGNIPLINKFNGLSEEKVRGKIYFKGNKIIKEILDELYPMDNVETFILCDYDAQSDLSSFEGYINYINMSLTDFRNKEDVYDEIADVLFEDERFDFIISNLMIPEYNAWGEFSLTEGMTEEEAKKFGLNFFDVRCLPEKYSKAIVPTAEEIAETIIEQL